MSNKIQIKRGLKANLPVLDAGEPAFTTDTKEFFVGDGTSNVEFAKQEDLEIINNQVSDLNFQTAGGTGTSITLKINQTITNGVAVTFIASTNNSGAATTINGKPLYKPNTKTVPNLIAGKAYTVWYNSTSDCFFIKASAEGNTIAAHVLAGDTFSNDNDTGLVGTLDLSNLVSGNIRSGVTISNGYTNITGKASVVDTADATASAVQILNGKIAYVNGSKVPGTMPENGALNASLNCGQSFNVPAGHTTGGTIAANSLASQTSASADASKILSGYSAWVNGNLINGNASIESLGGTQYASGYAVNTVTSIGKIGIRGIIFNTSFVPRIVLVVCDTGDMYIASSLNGNKVGMSIKYQISYNTYDSGAGHILGTTSQIGFSGYNTETNTNATWYAWS